MSSPPPAGPEWTGSDRASEPDGTAWAPAPSPRRPPLVTPLSDPLIPSDLRGWWERVFAVMHRSLVPLLIIQLVVAAVTAVLSYTVLPEPGAPVDPSGPARLLGSIGLVIVVAVGVLAQGTSVYVAIKDAARQPPTADAAMRFAIARAPALVGWGLVACLLTFVGITMLIVPGVYLAIVFGAALAGVVTVERGGIARCFELVNARFWPTVARMLLAVAAGAVYSAIAGFVVTALSAPGTFGEALLRAVVQVPLGMAAVGVAVVTYAELRFHERGEVFTATLAAEIDRPHERYP